MQRLIPLLLALVVFNGPACAAPPAAPVISILIDGIGYRHIDDRNAVALPGPIAYAIMPHSPHAVEMSELATRSGKDILLHLPMEAIEEHNNRFLGPGALRHDMNQAQFITMLVYDLRSVPNIIGVNNHMGSLLSADREKMAWLMAYLNARKIFYIDSVTTGNSVAALAAGSRNVPYLRRDVFLDNSTRGEDIEAQFDELVRIARHKGSAIAIGHPHPETIKILSTRLGRLDEYGVRLVGVKEMILHRQAAQTTKVSLD